ncbi:uncharacterized protein LOC125653531 [Ostrea edulis]|uniref:uncharacterized protein LOC125653531 n=1 Tax=Ostrea edulis TaxID=37623 RepID=UPI0024AEDFC4|nr:uncharacterized protein LOC125653531 [Ostrea edulis]XP_048739054.2 uncharacterized protein LOC125653531 [Ostrea edulis]XP_048739055.2 uncharacterized protein LOC125653531 [Ostrea edulis]XP_048739056.2 uncharacterized protein LOC125653531 [Ostrea edulis]XP_048739057.2 uncharacterized protein LOC125653531 [Ostrea edulis]
MDATREFYVEWTGSPLVEPRFFDCKVTFDPVEPLSRICVDVESFNIQDCNVKIHYYDHTKAVENARTYGCNKSPTKYCRRNQIDIGLYAKSAKSISKTSNSFRLKVYVESDAKDTKKDYTWVIGLVAVLVTVGIAMFCIIIYRRKRSTGTVFRNSEIPHTRLNNTTSDPAHPDPNLPPWYTANDSITTEYTVTVPVVVNTGRL